MFDIGGGLPITVIQAVQIVPLRWVSTQGTVDTPVDYESRYSRLVAMMGSGGLVVVDQTRMAVLPGSSRFTCKGLVVSVSCRKGTARS